MEGIESYGINDVFFLNLCACSMSNPVASARCIRAVAKMLRM